MAFILPLDLEQLLVTTLSGNVQIFTFLAIIFFSAIAARLRMPNMIFGVMFLIFVVLFADYVGGIYLLTLIATAIITFASFRRFTD